MKKIWFFNFVVFLAAFLLFQIELIVAKILLPFYGGSYVVWGACVVFFQLALLLGYVFAYFLMRQLGIDRSRYLYILIYVIAILIFPKQGVSSFSPNTNIPIVFDIFFVLVKNIGLAFFALATTSVILQRWLAASSLKERENPYVLYGFSNLGSFAGLLSYPFYFEARFDLIEQLVFWKICFWVLLAAQCVVLFLTKSSKKNIEVLDKPQINLGQVALWLSLSCASVILFLSVTNIISSEIAPIPLLWVIPLCIYLAAYVLIFKQRSFCPAWIKQNIAWVISVGVVCFYLFERGLGPGLLYGIIFYVVLFILCMRCQWELYDSRPKRKQDLAFYYVIIAVGGFLGGVIVSWIVPLVTTSFVEFFIGIWLLLLGLVLQLPRGDLKKNQYIRLMLILWMFILDANYNFVAVVLTFLVLVFLLRQLQKVPSRIFGVLLIVAFATPLVFNNLSNLKNQIYRHRNYYGIIKVFETNSKHFLYHGTTIHGVQAMPGDAQDWPLGYYHPTTPIGEILRAGRMNFKNIGIVGLGIGSLAAWAKENQTMDFFELDPHVYFVANKYFTHLKRSRGRLRFYFGDGRLLLEKISSGTYDLLIIDAFGSDAIPVHLLTLEAVREYRRVLRLGGVILFHLTNRFMNLYPVVGKIGYELNAYVAAKGNQGNVSIGAFSSDWIALTWDPKMHLVLLKNFKWHPIKEGMVAGHRTWSDQYSNILPYLNF